jgi:hypothetical protein
MIPFIHAAGGTGLRSLKSGHGNFGTQSQILALANALTRSLDRPDVPTAVWTLALGTAISATDTVNGESPILLR